jgi:quercetin dioxygenase-like cupin family protein
LGACNAAEIGKGLTMHPFAAAATMVAIVLNGAMASAQTTVPPLAIRYDDPSVKWGPCPALFPGACEIAVLQGDPGKPNADVLLKVGPGYLLPRHRHSSAERMILLEGRLRVKYDRSDAKILTPSTYAYGPAGLPHEAVCEASSRCVLFIAFEGPVDAELVPPGKP